MLSVVSSRGVHGLPEQKPEPAQPIKVDDTAGSNMFPDHI